jgi:two-component system, chemotaxis family, protein-glutamate methylesterase/glutaminase
MKLAGAIVIAESPDTAEYPDMPRAAAQAGADLTLPITDIGRVLNDLVAGAPLPASCGSPTRAAPSSTDDGPRSRGEAAGLRAAELRRRHDDLAAGRGATPQTVALAWRRAEESSSRAQRARTAAELAAGNRRSDR